MRTWITDNNGNRCSVEYWGTKEAAQKALDSLENCKDCSDCSRCSGCSGCSDCSHVAWLRDKKELQGDPDSASKPGVPPTPKIENIHAVVLAAASAPKALDMGTWHTCGTTHVPRGMGCTSGRNRRLRVGAISRNGARRSVDLSRKQPGAAGQPSALL